MSEVRPRITGSEMEWAILAQKSKNTPYRQATREEASYAISMRHPKLYGSDRHLGGGMLSNGARYYMDVGDHPEYATPEDTSFMGTVANEIAGENIVYDGMNNARTRNSARVGDFIVVKRVVDDELNTWGYHTSFCCDRATMPIDNQHLALLGIHLATHNIYAGAGTVQHFGKDAYYALGQKVLNLNTDFASSSHGTNDRPQPLLSTRDEPLADDSPYSRVHITSMDANMSPWASWMKLGVTSIVLRMIEHGYLGHELRFEKPMHLVAKNVAYDTDLADPINLRDGRTMFALDIQEQLLLRAQKMAARDQLSEEELRVLEEWERALVDLRTDPDLLYDRSDWVAKRLVLERFMDRHDLTFSSPEVAKKDRQFSHIGPHGIGKKLRETAWTKWMPRQEAIDRAYFFPPRTTRAATRGSLIGRFASKRQSISASWGTVATDRARYELGDPYKLTYRAFPATELGPETVQDSTCNV